MIVGIDVGNEKHYFRAFNWRGIELTRKSVAFSNSMEGFNSHLVVLNSLCNFQLFL